MGDFPPFRTIRMRGRVPRSRGKIAISSAQQFARRRAPMAPRASINLATQELRKFSVIRHFASNEIPAFPVAGCGVQGM
jgi:hypothetical protein